MATDELRELLLKLENVARMYANELADTGDGELAHEVYELQARARAAAAELEEREEPTGAKAEIKLGHGRITAVKITSGGSMAPDATPYEGDTISIVEPS